MKFHGFLYGHYDSRGGTVFVEGSSREVADKRFLDDVMYMNDGGFNDEERAGFIEADFMGPATVVAEEGVIAFLEQPFPDIDEGKTQALLKGHQDGDNQFAGKGPYEILVLPTDKSAPEGYGRPRWNDDAFSLIFVPIGVKEGQKAAPTTPAM